MKKYKHIITIKEKPELSKEENEFLKMIWEKGKLINLPSKSSQ